MIAQVAIQIGGEILILAFLVLWVLPNCGAWDGLRVSDKKKSARDIALILTAFNVGLFFYLR